MSSSLPSSGEMTNYKGVRRRKSGSWVSEIRLPNSRERIWLGSYDTPEKAARAFDAAYLCVRGGPGGGGGAEGLNFPSSPPAVVVRTSDRKEVLAAALSHANHQSAAAAAAAAAAESPSSESAAATVAPAVLEPEESPAESFDDYWSQVAVDNPLRLVSPHRMGSTDLPVSSSTAAAAADDMEESGWFFCELWRFDGLDESSSRH